MQFGSRFLFPLMVAAALSVMIFGGLGLAALTGHLPLFGAKTAHLDTPSAPNVVAATTPTTDPDLLVATRAMAIPNQESMTTAKCKDCGVIESVEGTKREPGGTGGPLVLKATVENGKARDSALNALLIRVRMDDGALRVLQEPSDMQLQLGQRVRVINGIIRPQS